MGYCRKLSHGGGTWYLPERLVPGSDEDGFYFDEDDTLTFYRVDSKKGAKIEVPDEPKEITISTYARKPELGHILEFNLKATYEAHDQGLCWVFPLDHRYDNPELQKHAMEIAEMWLLVTTHGISMTIW